MIDLGDVTTSLHTKLITLMGVYDAFVGDGVAPPGGGWPEGVPNTEAIFMPYVVLKYAGATQSMMSDVPLCTTFAVRFYVNYSLVAYENGRPQSDRLAQWSRDALEALDTYGSEQCGDLTARFDRIYIDSMTGAIRDDSIFPKMWAASTNFRMDVARAAQP